MVGRKVPAQWHTPISVIKHKTHTWAKIDNTGWKTIPMDLTKEISYFDNTKTFKRQQEYDLFFAYTKVLPLFDQRKIRDNRQFLPDIHEHVFQQEKHKAIPVLTSLDYGRPCRPYYDYRETQYNNSSAIADCYRRSGIIWIDKKELQH